MAIMRKIALKKEYVQVPNSTAKAVEVRENGNLSLQALGLIVNLWSYNVEEWELHKTELYKRFVKNKKTSVSNTWDELVESNYIHEFRYRNGNEWEHVYFYRIEPFTDEEVEEEKKIVAKELGLDWASDFQQLKTGSSKRGAQNPHISNTIPTKDSINEKPIKEIPIKENLNLNPIEEEPENKNSVADLETILWDSKIPKGLKIRIKTSLQNKSIYNLSIEEILELEDAYHYQVQNQSIVLDCPDDDLYSLNEKQFSNTVMKLLETMKGQTIDSVRAIIDKWIKTGLTYLQNDQYVLQGYDTKENGIYFNWLNAEEGE